MSNDKPPQENDNTHLSNLPDGAGCTEIWEHLSQQREEQGSN